MSDPRIKGKYRESRDAQWLREAIEHSDILLPSGPRFPEGKAEEPRKCIACDWSGKRADTFDIGWCPKCRSATF
jgi:hypothetical protein